MWCNSIALALAGYLLLGRSFAYLGIPPAKLFVGEVLLGCFMIARPRDVIQRWIDTCMRGSPLSPFSLSLAAFLLYGLFLFARGIANEYAATTALQSFVFHCYPFYVFLGIWAGTRRPTLLARAIPAVAWVHGLYGLAYVTFLDGIWAPIPTTDVNIFGQPNGALVIILALLSLPYRRPSDWGALALNLVVICGLQVRADWLALTVTVVVWGILKRRIGHLALAGLSLAAALAIASVADIRIPGPQDRGGEVTADKMFARVIAPVDIDTAKEFDGDADVYKGTTTWRMQWWEAIWAAVHDDPDAFFVGFGYGYPLSNLVPYLRNTDLRTPHNVLFYALGYGGWFGVCLFLLLQLQIVLLQSRVVAVTGDIFGLLVAIAALVAAFFGNLFETPFGAIPVYLLIGFTAAPLLRAFEGASA